MDKANLPAYELQGFPVFLDQEIFWRDAEGKEIVVARLGNVAEDVHCPLCNGEVYATSENITTFPYLCLMDMVLTTSTKKARKAMEQLSPPAIGVMVSIGVYMRPTIPLNL